MLLLYSFLFLTGMKKKNNIYASELEEVTITGNREISPGTFVLSYKPGESFIPGQVVKISLWKDEAPRIYSICSKTGDAEINLLYNIKNDGLLTPQLARCKSGDKLFVSKPYGSFTDNGQPAWWIATGTGIAPFYSMARSGLAENKRLIHGVRFLNQFYFEKELSQLMGNNYVKCCSRENSDGVFNGRVTGFLAQEKNIPQEIKYYLCGKALMVVEVRDFLIGRGVPYENIVSEIYF